MKIPEKITIAGITYTINEVEQESPELHYGGAIGYCDYQKGLINLDKNLKEDVKEVTLVHELVHGVLHSLNLMNENVIIDERFVESFAQLWYQVIKQL